MLLNEEGGYMDSSLFRHYFHLKGEDDEYDHTKVDLMFENPHYDREIFGISFKDHLNLTAML